MSSNTHSHRWLESSTVFVVIVLLGACGSLAQEKLPVKWEELTGPDFVQAISRAQNTCTLPFGIMEKHGPHMPIGTDLIDIRYVALHAAEEEYTVVFPEYYFGQINEARQQPGTIAFPAQLVMELLQASIDEMARNGCKKIIIANGHGGNPYMLQYFGQNQLNKRHDYVLYEYFGSYDRPKEGPPVTDKIDEHAGQSETSMVLVSRPDLVHMDRCKEESGARQGRDPLGGLNGPTNDEMNLFTPIAWWYSDFPNHYAGDGCLASKELGEALMKNHIQHLVEAIRAVKADNNSLRLQNEFYQHADEPTTTPQTGTWWIK